MKKIVFVGAGQMGKMALRMLNRNHYHPLGFADNNPSLWGKKACGLPIFPVEDIVSLEADAVFIAVAGKERAQNLEHQLLETGYHNEIGRLWQYMEDLDIRGAALELLAERMKEIPGDMAELGVYQGDFARRIHSLFPERTLYLFDTFAGFDRQDIVAEEEKGYSNARQGDFADTSLESVIARMPAPERVIPCKGYFPETTQGLEARFALVSLDADLYVPTLAGLRWFYPRLNHGGVILLHDYYNTRFSGVYAAVETFEKENDRLLLLPVCDAHGTVMIIHP